VRHRAWERLRIIDLTRLGEHFELVMEWEEELNIAIPDDEAERLQTVGDFIRYIEQRYRGEDRV
jgi:hypothetical protein